MTDAQLIEQYLAKKEPTVCPTGEYKTGKELSKTGAERFFERRVDIHHTSKEGKSK